MLTGVYCSVYVVGSYCCWLLVLCVDCLMFAFLLLLMSAVCCCLPLGVCCCLMCVIVVRRVLLAVC